MLEPWLAAAPPLRVGAPMQEEHNCFRQRGAAALLSRVAAEHVRRGRQGNDRPYQ